MSTSKEEGLVEAIKERLQDKLKEGQVLGPGRISIEVSPKDILEVGRYLRDELGFNYPIGAGAIDLIDEGSFTMNYYVYSTTHRVVLILKERVPRDNPVLPSLIPVWEAMNFHERETWELFGIEFKDHPNLSRFLLPEDWEGGYPLRKDFSLKEGGSSGG